MAGWPPLRKITLSPSTSATSATPVTRSQRDGNSPFSSPTRSSSNIILSPGTKSYLAQVSTPVFSSTVASVAAAVSEAGVSVSITAGCTVAFVAVLSFFLPKSLSSSLSICSSVFCSVFFLTFFSKSICEKAGFTISKHKKTGRIKRIVFIGMGFFIISCQASIRPHNLTSY